MTIGQWLHSPTHGHWSTSLKPNSQPLVNSFRAQLMANGRWPHSPTHGHWSTSLEPNSWPMAIGFIAQLMPPRPTDTHTHTHTYTRRGRGLHRGGAWPSAGGRGLHTRAVNPDGASGVNREVQLLRRSHSRGHGRTGWVGGGRGVPLVSTASSLARS